MVWTILPPSQAVYIHTLGAYTYVPSQAHTYMHLIISCTITIIMVFLTTKITQQPQFGNAMSF